MNLSFYTYKQAEFKCAKCLWSGLGEQTEQGELFADGFEIDCPNCQKMLELIPYPTDKEVLTYGSDADKLRVISKQQFWEEAEEMELKSIEQLPEIEGDNLIFVSDELPEEDEYNVVITCNGQFIWKERRYYEYYDRFIELGKLLKAKYGKRMLDFVPPDFQACLLGDYFHAPRLIREFREGLKK